MAFQQKSINTGEKQCSTGSRICSQTVGGNITILCQLHEGNQGQVNYTGSLSGSFPISNGVKQGCVLALTLFSISISMMLRGA